MDPKKKRSKIKVQKCVQCKMRKRRESKKRGERRGWMGRRERPRKEGRKEVGSSKIQNSGKFM